MHRNIYRCKTKATDREGDLIRFSTNWAFARRGELRLTDRAIECGDWTIPYEDIDDAVLLAIATPWGTSHTLKIKFEGTTYQFQLKSTSSWRNVTDPFWLGETPLPLREETAYVDWRASKPLMQWLLWSYLLAMILGVVIVATVLRLVDVL